MVLSRTLYTICKMILSRAGFKLVVILSWSGFKYISNSIVNWVFAVPTNHNVIFNCLMLVVKIHYSFSLKCAMEFVNVFKDGYWWICLNCYGYAKSEDAAKEALIYIYKYAANGFSAKLTPDQASQLSSKFSHSPWSWRNYRLVFIS